MIIKKKKKWDYVRTRGHFFQFKKSPVSGSVAKWCAWQRCYSISYFVPKITSSQGQKTHLTLANGEYQLRLSLNSSGCYHRPSARIQSTTVSFPKGCQLPGKKLVFQTVQIHPVLPQRKDLILHWVPDTALRSPFTQSGLWIIVLFPLLVN